MAGGTAAAQAITIAFAPIITRLYGPEAFGVQGTFMSLVAIATPLSALAYPIAIVLPKSDADAMALKRLSMAIAIAIAALVALTLLLLSENLVAALGYQAIAPYLPLLPAVIGMAAALQATREWLIRKRRFSVLARIAVVQALLVNGARVGFGAISATAATLVAITAAGIGVHAAMQAWGGRRKPDEPPIRPEPGSMLRMARSHRDFPLFRAPEMIVNSVSESLPVLVLAAAFGPAEAGFYALARAMLYMPLNLIGQSVAQVFYPRFNAQAQDGLPLLPLFLKAVGALAAMGLPIFGAIALIGPWLFAFAFGAEWERGGQYASLLTLWLFVMFVNRPCIGATSVLGMQRMFFLQGLLALSLRFLGLWVGWQVFGDDLWAIGLFSVAGAVAGALLIVLVAFRARKARPPQAETDHAAA